MEEENREQTVVQENPVKEESKGLSIASLVLGIISIVLFCYAYISIPCAILAIIFSIIGKKKGGLGMAKAGLILGIISLAIIVLFYILAFAGLATLTSVIGGLI